MKNLLAALLIVLGFASSAQTSTLKFYTADGNNFTIYFDGALQNNAPANQVVVDGIFEGNHSVVAVFENSRFSPLEAQLPVFANSVNSYELKRTFENGAEKYVLNGGGSSSTQGTANVSMNVGIDGFNMNVNINDANVQQNTTTTTTTTSSSSSSGWGVPNGGVNMNVNMNTDMNSNMNTNSNVQTTHTQTNSWGGQQTTYVEDTRCPGGAMASHEFSSAKGSIESKTFEDDKLKVAKQITRNNCLSSDQVAQVMGLFTFEDSRVEYAMFAYDYVYDANNYYKVNDAFEFSFSIDELDEYIESK